MKKRTIKCTQKKCVNSIYDVCESKRRPINYKPKNYPNPEEFQGICDCKYYHPDMY